MAEYNSIPHDFSDSQGGHVTPATPNALLATVGQRSMSLQETAGQALLNRASTPNPDISGARLACSCGATFSRKDALARHLNSGARSANAVRIPCHLCDKYKGPGSNRRDHLRQHFKLHHKITNTKELSDLLKKAEAQAGRPLDPPTPQPLRSRPASRSLALLQGQQPIDSYQRLLGVQAAGMQPAPLMTYTESAGDASANSDFFTAQGFDFDFNEPVPSLYQQQPHNSMSGLPRLYDRQFMGPHSGSFAVTATPTTASIAQVLTPNTSTGFNAAGNVPTFLMGNVQDITAQGEEQEGANVGGAGLLEDPSADPFMFRFY